MSVENDSGRSALESKKKQAVNVLLIINISIAFLLTSFFSILVVKKYEETAYQSEGYADSVDSFKNFLQSKKDCLKYKGFADQNRCQQSVDVVANRYMGLLELAAQDTVAKATRGILWISAIQAITGFATVGFIFWTVRQTKGILDQSTAMTELTGKTLGQAEISATQAKVATETELQPYIDFQYAGIRFYNAGVGNDFEVGIELAVEVRNSGKTPMENTVLSIDPASQFYVNVANRDGTGADDILIGVSFVGTFVGLVDQNQTHGLVVRLHGTCRTSNGQTVRKLLNKTISAYSIQTSHLFIRYKDLTCINSDSHVLIQARITEDPYIRDGDPMGTRIFKKTTELDSDNQYFSNR